MPSEKEKQLRDFDLLMAVLFHEMVERRKQNQRTRAKKRKRKNAVKTISG